MAWLDKYIGRIGRYNSAGMGGLETSVNRDSDNPNSRRLSNFANELAKEGITDRKSIISRGLKKGFTLIELLVVVSVIVGLMGLLLPAIAKARESARRIQCVNNLGQIGKAIQYYANDYNGFIPTMVGTTSSDEKIWNGAEYFLFGKLIPLTYIKRADTLEERKDVAKFFFCPSNNRYTKDNIKNLETGTVVRSSYRMAATDQGAPVRLGNENANYVVLADYETRNPFGTGPWIARAHETGKNTLFSDGHVEYIGKDIDMQNTDSYGGDSSPGARDGAWSKLNDRKDN